MTILNEYHVAADYLFSKLSTPAMTGLKGVWEHPAPANADYPLITFALYAPKDVEVVDHTRVWAELLMIVTAIGQTESTNSLKPYSDAIDSRLQGATYPVTTASGRILSINREGIYQRPEETRLGLRFRRVGGYFRMVIQPLTV